MQFVRDDDLHNFHQVPNKVMLDITTNFDINCHHFKLLTTFILRLKYIFSPNFRQVLSNKS